jgi:hypothetical protein
MLMIWVNFNKKNEVSIMEESSHSWRERVTLMLSSSFQLEALVQMRKACICSHCLCRTCFGIPPNEVSDNGGSTPTRPCTSARRR